MRTHGPNYDVVMGDLNEDPRAGVRPMLGVQASYERGQWVISIVGPAGRWKMPRDNAAAFARALALAVADCDSLAREAGTPPP